MKHTLPAKWVSKKLLGKEYLWSILYFKISTLSGKKKKKNWEQNILNIFILLQYLNKYIIKNLSKAIKYAVIISDKGERWKQCCTLTDFLIPSPKQSPVGHS